MLEEKQFFCCDLPMRTVAISFDDGPGETAGPGPGPRTLELAEYLAAEQVPAAFFVIGERARQYPAILKRLHALGHLVGNHTTSHANLGHMLSNGQDASAQILETNRIIRDVLGHQQPILFRAPWGLWEQAVAHYLSNDARLKDTVGPIAWDVPALSGDWDFWNQEKSPASCAEFFFQEIEAQGRGIVDLHDHSFEEGLWQKNRTFEMIKLLVPMLKRAGYSFVRLDAIPEIREAIARAA